MAWKRRGGLASWPAKLSLAPLRAANYKISRESLCVCALLPIIDEVLIIISPSFPTPKSNPFLEVLPSNFLGERGEKLL